MGGMGGPMGGMGGFGHPQPNFANQFAPPRGGPQRGPEKPCGGGVGNNNKVQWIKKLGEGKFGETWEVEYEGNNLAAKVTCCPTGFPDGEIEMMKRAQGPFTCKFVGREDKTSKGTCIIMQKYPSNLEKQIEALRHPERNRRQGMPKMQFLKALEQISEGLAWLHDKEIMFGDLKPDNILFDKTRDRLVFCDFGDSQQMAENQVKYFGNPEETGWGHPQYHAVPDVMSKQRLQQSDMWMLAQTAYHMWTGKEPAQNPEILPTRIPLRKVLLRCYNSQPSQRPSSREFLQKLREYDAPEENADDDVVSPPPAVPASRGSARRRASVAAGPPGPTTGPSGAGAETSPPSSPQDQYMRAANGTGANPNPRQQLDGPAQQPGQFGQQQFGQQQFGGGFGRHSEGMGMPGPPGMGMDGMYGGMQGMRSSEGMYGAGIQGMPSMPYAPGGMRSSGGRRRSVI